MHLLRDTAGDGTHHRPEYLSASATIPHLDSTIRAAYFGALFKREVLRFIAGIVLGRPTGCRASHRFVLSECSASHVVARQSG